jgi:nitrous oxidase accessory protein NosD
MTTINGTFSLVKRIIPIIRGTIKVYIVPSVIIKNIIIGKNTKSMCIFSYKANPNKMIVNMQI